jgi:hypothetical protein
LGRLEQEEGRVSFEEAAIVFGDPLALDVAMPERLYSSPALVVGLDDPAAGLRRVRPRVNRATVGV